MSQSDEIKVYKAINGILPSEVNHLISGKSLDAVFGEGCYFSFAPEDAFEYLDDSQKYSLIIEYLLFAPRLLNIYAGKNNSGFSSPSNGVDFFDLELSKKLGDSFDGDQLTNKAFPYFDAIALYEDEEKIDGGEQLIVISPLNIKIMPLKATIYVKGKKIGEKNWSELLELAADDFLSLLTAK